MTALALDTSVAVPLLLASHQEHGVTSRWLAGRAARLCGHAAAETYSVLTRLPGDARLTPADAAHLLRERFLAPLVLGPTASEVLIDRLGALEVVGGAVYDALIGLAAVEHDAELATRDARARGTYDVVGARVVLVAA